MSLIFPTISQYIDAIQIPDSFATRKSLRPVYKEDGTPYFSSGNFAVVFKMEDVYTEKEYAIKCFLRDVERRDEAYRLISNYLDNTVSPYLVPYEYLDREIWVNEDDFPILIMDWVEGFTLAETIEDLIGSLDIKKLRKVALAFDQMSIWLLSQEFAHGDLKPDNIIFQENGTPVLVDYDGCFVPEMAGWEAMELGTPGFQHPLRKLSDFNKSIDDVGIFVISISLHFLVFDPWLWYSDFGHDCSLFSADDLENFSNCAICNSFSEMHLSLLRERLFLIQRILDSDFERVELFNSLKVKSIDVAEFKYFYDNIIRSFFPNHKNLNFDFEDDFDYEISRINQEKIDHENNSEVIASVFKSGTIIRKGRKYGLRSNDGSISIECKYDYLSNTIGDLFLAVTNNKFAVINYCEKTIIEDKYDFIFDNGENYFIAINDEFSFGVFDIYGQLIVPFEYQCIRPIGEFFEIISQDRFGLLSICEGKAVINVPCIYTSLNELFDDCFIVEKGFNEYGVIDCKGNKLIPTKYIQIKKISNTIVECIRRTYENDIIKDEKNYFKKKNSDFTNLNISKIFYDSEENLHVFIASRNNMFGVVSNNGDVVLGFQFDDVFNLFGQNVYWVLNKNMWGAVNGKGDCIIDFKYDSVHTNLTYFEYCNNSSTKFYFYAKTDGLCALYDSFGNLLIDLKYSSLEYWRDDYFIVSLSGKYGIIDSKDNVIVGLNYDGIRKPETHLEIVVKKNNMYGVINLKEEVLINFKFKQISYLEDKGLFVVKSNDKCACIDRNGHTIIKNYYDEIRSIHGNHFAVFNKVGYKTRSAIVNHEGKEISWFNFTEAKYFAEYNLIYTYNNCCKINSNHNVNSLISVDGEIILYGNSLKIISKSPIASAYYVEMNSCVGIFDLNERKWIFEPKYSWFYECNGLIFLVRSYDYSSLSDVICINPHTCEVIINKKKQPNAMRRIF